MNEKKLERIINFFREEMMTTQSTAGKPGFSGSSDPKGPTAGFDPVMGVTKRKKYLSLGNGSRKRWMDQNNK